MKEIEITREMFEKKEEVFANLLSVLGIEGELDGIVHQAKVDKSGSNYLKVDFKGEVVLADGDREKVIIEFQKGKANMDHAKALVYPLIDENCKRAIWIAESYGEYVKKAVQKFNEKLGGDGYTFYLVTYRRVEGNMDFTKVV